MKKALGAQMVRNITVLFVEAEGRKESLAVAIKPCHFHFIFGEEK